MAKLKSQDILLNKRISERIEELRKKENPNQSQFAREHDTDRQTLYRWENPSEKRGVSIHTIHRFCNMIGISLKEFFNDPRFTKD